MREPALFLSPVATRVCDNSAAKIRNPLSAASPILHSETAVSVSYRSVPDASQDEEVEIGGNGNTGGGSSANESGSSQRRRKLGVIFGRAWR